MDDTSRQLDLAYKSLHEKRKQIQIHAQALSILTERETDDPFVCEQIANHSKSLERLEHEEQQVILGILDDLMLVDDPNIITILKLRYLDNLGWDAIASKMGLQRRWVMRMRDRGLACIISKRRDQ